MRFLAIAIAGLVMLGGCSLLPPPSNLDNMCDILEQRPGWNRLLRKVWKDYDLHPSLVMAFIHQESRFKHNARPPSEVASKEKYAVGAWGYAQAKKASWQDFRYETKQLDAKRENFAAAVDFIGWYNYKSHVELHIPLDNARELYLAYHEGRGGYERGSHEQKPNLKKVAKKVESRTDMYRRQYRTCRDRSDRTRYVRPPR